ncbi:MAG TPA: hypothetical protein DEF45_19970 [Rhodopirellula sp.]|nr:hypothetical protein [Rhodopirellula sp.]
MKKTFRKPIKLKPGTKALLCLCGVGLIAFGGWLFFLSGEGPILNPWLQATGFFVCLIGLALFMIPAMDEDQSWR